MPAAKSAFPRDSQAHGNWSVIGQRQKGRKTMKKLLHPYPVYEAHFTDGTSLRMSFASPAGKLIDAARGQRVCLLTIHAQGMPELVRLRESKLRDVQRRQPNSIGDTVLDDLATRHETVRTARAAHDNAKTSDTMKTALAYLEAQGHCAMVREAKDAVADAKLYQGPRTFSHGFVEHPTIGRVPADSLAAVKSRKPHARKPKVCPHCGESLAA
jgi:hypothetical protein